ncbi:hypothetical protein QQF64_017048 [Cirrhinus molitorella]|uniref:Uncharacterized protein n=1 Tax=Cirrhinus molitorella TaxID=172907 RepID=A0ABR3LJ67_9TELE
MHWTGVTKRFISKWSSLVVLVPDGMEHLGFVEWRLFQQPSFLQTDASGVGSRAALLQEIGDCRSQAFLSQISLRDAIL